MARREGKQTNAVFFVSLELVLRRVREENASLAASVNGYKV